LLQTPQSLIIFLIASPKAKQKLVENKITHILSIHDAAEPGDGVSSLDNEMISFNFV